MVLLHLVEAQTFYHDIEDASGFVSHWVSMQLTPPSSSLRSVFRHMSEI